MNAPRPGRRHPDADRITERLTELLARESVAGDYVRLRIGVLKAQAATLRELADAAREPQPAPFDPALARRLFQAIADEIRRHGNPGDDLARLEASVDDRPALLEKLVRRSAAGPAEGRLARLGGTLDVSSELVIFVGRLIAAPFVALGFGRQASRRSAPDACPGACPACGSTPALASLRPEDGGRVLHCSLCGHAWPFGRLECPFCETGYQAKLARLTVAGEDARWIEACDRCRHYLKVVDRRHRPEGDDFIPLVEEVDGMYLDLVAEKEGYLRNPPYAAPG